MLSRMAQRLTSVFRCEEIHRICPTSLRSRTLGNCRQKLGELFASCTPPYWRRGLRQNVPSQSDLVAVGLGTVRRLLPILFFCVVAGCSRQPVQEAAVADIRGQPIVASDVKTRTATSSEGSPAVHRGLQGAVPQVGDYVSVGFDKLSGYGFEL